MVRMDEEQAAFEVNFKKLLEKRAFSVPKTFDNYIIITTNNSDKIISRLWCFLPVANFRVNSTACFD